MQGKKRRDLKDLLKKFFQLRDLTSLTFKLTFVLVLFGFLLFFFRSCMLGINFCLNTILKKCFAEQWETIYSVMQSAGKRNLASFIGMAFTVGSVILKISQDHFLSEVNPHKVKDYINVELLAAILVCFTITSLYAHLTYLYTLEVISVVLLLCYSFALAVNTYLFHNPERLAKVSANYLIRVGKIRVCKIRVCLIKVCDALICKSHDCKSQVCSILDTRQIDWMEVINEVSAWHELYTDTTSGVLLGKKAHHQALIIKKLKEIDKYWGDLLPFIIGFYAVNPYSNVDSKVQQMYVRFLAKELVTHDEFSETNYYKHILGGIMVGYIIHKVRIGSFKTISKKNLWLWKDKRKEDSDRLVVLLKECFSDYCNMIYEIDKNISSEENVNIFTTILSECTNLWLSIIIVFNLVMPEQEVKEKWKYFYANYVYKRYDLQEVNYKTSDYYSVDDKHWVMNGTSDLWKKLMITEEFSPVNGIGQMEWSSFDIFF